MSAGKVICPEHGWVATIGSRQPTCPNLVSPGARCAKPCTVEPEDKNEADLNEARDLYFSLGGTPSQSATPRRAPWYWRRAAKMMRSVRDAVPLAIAEWLESDPHGNSGVESRMLADDVRAGEWRKA